MNIYINILKLMAAAAVLAGLAACETTEIALPVWDRVLLIYFGGDNNLSEETYQKIEAIKGGLIADDPLCRVVLYHDPADGVPVLSELKNVGGQALVDTIAVYGEENSAAPEVLIHIINSTREKYPARRYSMLVFTHGSGWLPQGALNNPGMRSIVMDGDAEMELAAFAGAIPDGMFDCVVFEACLMAGVEVAYEMRKKTGYILASSAEIVSPGFTPVYSGALHYLLRGEIEGFAKEAYAYVDRQKDDMRSGTISVIRTDGLEELAAFIAANCNPDIKPDIASIQRFDRNRHILFLDFEDYYSRLLEQDSRRIDLSRLIDNCVVWKEATPTFLPNASGFSINQYSGMTVYMPQEAYPALNRRYEETEWQKASKHGKQ